MSLTKKIVITVIALIIASLFGLNHLSHYYDQRDAEQKTAWDKAHAAEKKQNEDALQREVDAMLKK